MNDVIICTLNYWANRYIEHVADGNLGSALNALRAYRRLLEWVHITEDQEVA